MMSAEEQKFDKLVDQLAENSWSHFCYSPLIISGSAGREHQPADPRVMSGEEQKFDKLYSAS
jgi:hypothetical protein